MFREDISTSAEVIGGNMLNFKPNFECSRLKFLGDSVGCALASVGQSLARVKVSRNSTRKGRNIVFRKSPLMSKSLTHNFFVCGPKFTNFSSSNGGGVVVD